MKAVVQRVASAEVSVAGRTSGVIGSGILILLGIRHDDTAREVRWVADKCLNLRIFEDGQGKMNRSVIDISGDILVVSQFTLYGDTGKGRRPSFSAAAPPSQSRPLYELFLHLTKEKSGLKLEQGVFGAVMRVSSVNDGPVTFIVEKNHEPGLDP